MLFSTLAMVGAFTASAVEAHMIMARPKPFGNPDNSNLAADGSNYPCKLTGPAGQLDFTQNQFKVGENQTLAFSGSAVHGGGSCQLSVTLDKAPSKTSKFKVIHSIEGKCPGVDGPAEFSFPIPSELPNGEAVFAWTWIPRLSGQKEFYMNCAAFTLSGGSDDTKGFDSLPDMAVTNIKPFCGTPEGNVYSYPNPGKSVERNDEGRKFVPVCQNEGSSAGTPASGSQPESGAGASPAAPDNGQPKPSADQPVSKPGVFAPGASSQLDPVTSTIQTLVTVTAPTGAPTSNVSTQAPAAPTLSAQPSATGAPSTQPSSAPGSGTGEKGTCSTDGAIVCNGETQFGICDHGKVIWQAVAPGTKCADGKIAKRNFLHRVRRFGH